MIPRELLCVFVQECDSKWLETARVLWLAPSPSRFFVSIHDARLKFSEMDVLILRELLPAFVEGIDCARLSAMSPAVAIER
jgi:hypothetical protein